MARAFFGRYESVTLSPKAPPYCTNSFNHKSRKGEFIFLQRNAKNDAKHDFRLDAGPLVRDQFRYINLQVNKEARSQHLVKWIRKHGTHAKLASAIFDLCAKNRKEECQRVLKQLLTEGINNL